MLYRTVNVVTLVKKGNMGKYKDLHDKGEKDASEGKHEPPHDPVELLPIISDVCAMLGGKSWQEKCDENNAYDAGHKNTTDQIRDSEK